MNHKIFWLLVILTISLIAFLGIKTVLAPKEAQAQSTATISSPQLVSQTVPLSLKEKVEKTFFDSPLMIAKLKCESGYHQFKDDGSILLSPTNDVGIAQINSQHWLTAAKMGLDVIGSADDNLKFARWLYDESGSGNWFAPSTPDCR